MQNQQSEAPDFSEDKDEIDEDGEEDFLTDEDFGEENGDRKSRPGSCLIARTITLQMLLADHLLEPGEGAMSIEYMGQRFIGDLLLDGKIRSQETDIIFATPSAWAVNCKRIINPVKRSGCGWASVRYKGRKLDAYKNIWINRRNEERKKESVEADDIDLNLEKDTTMLAPPSATTVPAPRPAPPPPPLPLPPPPPPPPPTSTVTPVRVPVKHHTIGSRTSMHDPNMLVESTSFSALGKIQPFLVSISTNAVLIMDYHCHLTTSEVCGYLAGQWDVNAHNLSVTNAYPCHSRLDDKINGPLVEKEIRLEIEQRGLIPVGWYHSHPTFPASPSLRDIDKQLDHEMHMKGSSDSSYTPCIGVICSPYFSEASSMESSIISFWVAPPPENKPLEYGKPMLMSYSVVQDTHLTHDVLKELSALVEFYKDKPDFIDFNKSYKSDVTYLEKLKVTLTPKFPKDQTDGVLWGFIRQLVTPGAEECDESGNPIIYKPEVTTTTTSTISTPTTSTNTTTLVVPLLQIGNRNSSSSITSPSSSNVNSSTCSSSGSAGVFLGADMASAIIAAGKLPAGTSLMSVLPGSSQNMFLSPLSLNLLGNSGSSGNSCNIKGSKPNSISSSSIASLAAISTLSNLGGLGNLSIANLANLNNLTLSSLGNLNSLANISLSNKSTTSTNLNPGGIRNNINFSASSANCSVSPLSTANSSCISSTSAVTSTGTSTVSIAGCTKTSMTSLKEESSQEICAETMQTLEKPLSCENSSILLSPLKGSKSSSAGFSSSNGNEGERHNNYHSENSQAETEAERPAKLPKYDSVATR